MGRKEKHLYPNQKASQSLNILLEFGRSLVVEGYFPFPLQFRQASELESCSTIRKAALSCYFCHHKELEISRESLFFGDFQPGL